MTKKLKPRTIVVGSDERSAKVRIVDQETLRLLREIEDLLPARRRAT